MCWPSAGTAPIAASRPGALTGGSSARTGPAGRSTSRHRSLAASCGCAANSAGVRSRALAMPASSSRATTSSGVMRSEHGLDDRRQLAVVRHPVRVGGEPLVGDQVRPAQHPLAEHGPFSLVLQAQEYPARPGRGRTGRWRRAGRRCAGRPARRRRCSSRAGSSTRPGRPAGTRRSWTRAGALALVARSAHRCRRTSRPRCRRQKCPPYTARRACR